MVMHIDEMYAFVAIDPDDRTEGVVGFQSPTGWIPMVGADMAMVEKLRPIAEEIAASGQEIKLIHFSTRTEIETLGGPDGT